MIHIWSYMEVSQNRDTPILFIHLYNGLSAINHPAIGDPHVSKPPSGNAMFELKRTEVARY